jgi:hypothetical protein
MVTYQRRRLRGAARPPVNGVAIVARTGVAIVARTTRAEGPTAPWEALYGIDGGQRRELRA